jgi:thiamine biosynthesis lipoprotein
MRRPDTAVLDRPATRPHTRRFEAIGTRWQIDTDRELGPAEWLRLDARIDEFDRTWSRFRSDSLVSRLAEAAGTVEFPSEAVALIDLYRRLHDGTDGAVTPLVGGVLADLGYDAQYRFTPATTIRDTPAWDEIMSWDGPVVTTTRPVVLDVGAAGKGYLVDIVGELLSSFGVGSFVVDGSGDLLHHGPADREDSIRVGLEHPADPSQVIGVVQLSDDALAASAGNRRAWAGVHHIVDARTGEPARDVVATWVIAGSAMVADGLATALFFTSPERTHPLADSFGADWLRVLGNGTAHWSPTFEGELFS